MELFNPKHLKFDWAKHFKLVGWTSFILCIVSLVCVFTVGLNYDIDFRGGIEAHVQFPQGHVSQKELREVLETHLKNVSVVNFSEAGVDEFLVTAQSQSKESLAQTLKTTLTAKYGTEGTGFKVTKMDVVGPKVGHDLRKSAILSLLYTCLLVGLYLYWRFDVRFVPGALACIVHDLLITVLFLLITRMEFSMTVVAALLTLAGYSINDTVVVFDRIRETEHKYMGRDKKFIVNDAVNSTLSRTIMTAATTMVCCLVLFFVGGEALRPFSAALFIGILVGTYSSVYVATPLWVWSDRYFERKAAEARAS
jgi:preprotein translocase subunit SecF